MRADARRNRDRLLDTAVEMILETGGEPPRDAIARRAGVGVATLYRHFPDRRSLLEGVALHVLDRNLEAGERCLDESTDGFDALRRYLHAAVDNGVGVLNIVHPLLDRPHWPDRRARSDALLDTMLRRATDEGRLRAGISSADIGFAVIRFCRPLAVGLAPADERAVAHRQIDVFVDGLARDGRTIAGVGPDGIATVPPGE